MRGIQRAATARVELPFGRTQLWRAIEERRVHGSRPWAVVSLRRCASLHEPRW